MAKIIKYLLLTLVSLVVLIAVALAGVVMFVDPNDYKDEITAAVQDATGRELTLAGDLELSVFPWLGLSLGGAQLSNAEGFGDVPFAKVAGVDIGVNLLPLLQKRLEMKTIRLHVLQVQLAKNADGRTLVLGSMIKKTAMLSPPVSFSGFVFFRSMACLIDFKRPAI